MFASRKKGGGHDSSAGLEAEGYSGKSAISPPPPRALFPTRHDSTAFPRAGLTL